MTRKVLFDDNIPRITCPDCGWIQLVSNVVGVAVVAPCSYIWPISSVDTVAQVKVA
ncbi:MAG: zinc ribbon domain-containing protein [Caldilineaceae bacterium]|nr:zinc ribbon domain-containing protein [Caldilineaceae bacterium]